MNRQIEAMQRLGLSDDEIQDVIAADLEIDKGAKLFELDAEKELASRKARTVNKTPTSYNFNKRERKPNEDKRAIIKIIAECFNCTILNPERELEFIYNDKKYKITLSAPRS